MLKGIYILLKSIEAQMAGSPEVSFHFYKERFYIRVQWPREQLVIEKRLTGLDIIRMVDEEAKLYMEAFTRGANREYREALEKKLKEAKKF